MASCHGRSRICWRGASSAAQAALPVSPALQPAPSPSVCRVSFPAGFLPPGQSHPVDLSLRGGSSWPRAPAAAEEAPVCAQPAGQLPFLSGSRPGVGHGQPSGSEPRPSLRNVGLLAWCPSRLRNREHPGLVGVTENRKGKGKGGGGTARWQHNS